jgi:hypothetical protein
MSTLICTVHTRSHNIEVQPQNKKYPQQTIHSQSYPLTVDILNAVSFVSDYEVTLQDENKCMKFCNERERERT